MKIVTWNCNGALRNKTECVDSLDADILVIQECEDPKRSSEVYLSWAGEHFLWAGKDKNKGIGVFARKGNTIRKLEWKGEYRLEVVNNISEATSWNSEDLQSFLPLIVNETHTLLAVWLKHAGSKYFGYIGQMWKYLQIHKQDLAINDKTIICGDLNSNEQWDSKDRWWNHTDVVRELCKIRSRLDTQSGLSWTPNPEATGHSIRF